MNENDRIGPYVVEELLGVGGFGRVYLCRDPAGGRRVVVKMLVATGQPDAAKRFKREARILATLGDRHVIPYIGSDLEASPPYIVMAHVHGRDLGRLMRESNRDNHELGPVEKLRWITDVARGLAAAHRKGVVHRDLKPPNVLVDEEGRGVLLDFGLALLDHSSVTSLTASGAVLGTILYMSPEQLHGREPIPASDVYQWALLAHQLFVGELPYSGMEPLAAAERRAANGVTVAAGMDPGLARLVERCLLPEPALRPRDGGELLALLEGLSPGTSVTATATAPEPWSVPDGGFAAPGSEATGGAGLRLAPGEGLVVGGTPTSEDRTLSIPGYRVMHLLGRGGMGLVYEAHNKASGERVAVKVIRPGKSADPEALRRFEREARLLQGVQSPNVVRVLDFRMSEGEAYLIMEFVPGETLSRHLESRGRPGLGNALRIVTQAVTGVADLHRRGIVHRDLKPGNLMLTPGGTARVLDLGLATTGPVAAGSSRPAGTPLYLPPEVLSGGTAGPPGDVFQLGLILYEACTAKRDFRSPDAPDILRGYLHRDKASGSPRGQELVSRVVTVFQQCTDPDPLARPPDAAALLRQLRPIEEEWRSLSGAPARASGGTRSDPDSSVIRMVTPPAATGRASSVAALAKAAQVLLAAVILAAAAWVLRILPEIAGRMGH